MKNYDPPALGEDERSLLDYLELFALISDTRRSQIMALVDDIRVQLEDPDENYGEEYLDEDQIFAAIEVRLKERHAALGSAYPFRLSETGSEIEFEGAHTPEVSAYLACLIISFFRRLPGGWDKNLTDLEVQATQRIFQLISTIALAGYVKGCAVSLGWPRREKEELLSALKRAHANGSSVQPLSEPSDLAPPAAKDGGIDVMAWALPPVGGGTVSPRIVWGQVATGNGWHAKNAAPDLVNFDRFFIASRPTNSNETVTIIPFWRAESDIKPHVEAAHGFIMDRMTVARHFAEGLANSAAGFFVDEVAYIDDLQAWPESVRGRLC